MSYKLFDRSPANLHIEWNAAKPSDWKVISRNFVAAYLFSYQNKSLTELQFSEELINNAEAIWDLNYKNGFEAIMQNMIKPLQFYLNKELRPLQKEYLSLQMHFKNPFYDIKKTKADIVKLYIPIALQDAKL